jgi:chromosome segregation ATPase
MDSEMYADFNKSKKPSSMKQLFLPITEEEEEENPKDSYVQVLEKIFMKLHGLDNRIVKQLESLIHPLLDANAKEKRQTTEASSANSGAITEQSLAEIDQLLSDVQALKKEMADGNWKNPPADVIDQLISDVRDLKHDFEKRKEAITQSGGAVEQLENQIKLNIQTLRKEIGDLKQEVSLLAQNLGNLFTFVYATDRGKTMKLKGGWKDEKFVIQTSKPNPTQI